MISSIPQVGEIPSPTHLVFIKSDFFLARIGIDDLLQYCSTFILLRRIFRGVHICLMRALRGIIADFPVDEFRALVDVVMLPETFLCLIVVRLQRWSFDNSFRFRWLDFCLQINIRVAGHLIEVKVYGLNLKLLELVLIGLLILLERFFKV